MKLGARVASVAALREVRSIVDELRSPLSNPASGSTNGLG
jgi:hypothetical protein